MEATGIVPTSVRRRQPACGFDARGNTRRQRRERWQTDE